MTARILLVDDESDVLEALRDRLRPARARWRVEIAQGAAAARDLLAEKGADVVLCDLSLIGGGDKLLEDVRATHPNVVRVLSSSRQDSAAAIAGARCAHQLLGRPFDVSTLLDALERASELAALIARPEIAAAARALGAPPPAPPLLTTLSNLGRDDVQTLSRALQSSPLVCAKLLQVASSPLFAGRRPIDSLDQAILRLGVTMTREIACALAAQGALGRAVSSSERERLAVHGMRVARLVGALSPVRSETALSTALLHDVGLLIAPTAEADHAALGAYVLALWGLPRAIVEGVAAHHAPSDADLIEMRPAALVYLAETLACPEDATGPLDEARLASLGHTPASIETWRAQLARAEDGP